MKPAPGQNFSHKPPAYNQAPVRNQRGRILMGVLGAAFLLGGVAVAYTLRTEDKQSLTTKSESRATSKPRVSPTPYSVAVPAPSADTQSEPVVPATPTPTPAPTATSSAESTPTAGAASGQQGSSGPGAPAAPVVTTAPATARPTPTTPSTPAPLNTPGATSSPPPSNVPTPAVPLMALPANWGGFADGALGISTCLPPGWASRSSGVSVTLSEHQAQELLPDTVKITLVSRGTTVEEARTVAANFVSGNKGLAPLRSYTLDNGNLVHGSEAHVRLTAATTFNAYASFMLLESSLWSITGQSIEDTRFTPKYNAVLNCMRALPGPTTTAPPSPSPSPRAP